MLEQQLTSVDRKHAAWCIGKLLTGFNERLTRDEASLRVEVWIEACGDLPNDLWTSATVELLRSWKRDDHYGRVPEPSDFRATVQERITRRTLDLQRAKSMLAKANEPETNAEKPARYVDRRPKEMLDRHAKISRRRVGMFGPTPAELDAWWSQIEKAAAAEGLAVGTQQEWTNAAI